ncbi:MAG: GCN5-related N-acetyltransferase [Actinomycetia bacterium]|nr:GCN5-related N-acetyltransferase [Actinomycetes bacterium]
MIEVQDNPDQGRFEIHVDGELAGYARYLRRAGRIILVHTEIDGAFEGQGLGSKLAAGVLDDVRSRNLKVVPLCPFMAKYIERHPDFADLVDEAALAALDD